MKRVHKSADGKYHIAGKKYDILVGSCSSTSRNCLQDNWWFETQ